MIKLISNYITPEEETLLLSQFRKTPLSPTKERNSIIRYGSSLPYQGRVKPEIPLYWNFLLERLRKHDIIDSDSITVNEYHPNQAISYHIDSPSSGPAIIVLSLLSHATMAMRPKHTKSDITNYVLPPRSLLIMTEEHRYQWEHSILPVTSHRYSVVFRKGTISPPRDEIRSK